MSGLSLLERILAGEGDLPEDQALFGAFARAAQDAPSGSAGAEGTEADDFASIEVAEADWPADEDERAAAEGREQPDQEDPRKVAGAAPEAEEGRPVRALHAGGGWRLAWRFPAWEVRLDGPGPATVRVGDTEQRLEVGVWVRRAGGKPPPTVVVIPETGTGVLLPRVK